MAPPQAIWYVDKLAAGWSDPSPVMSTFDPDWHRGGPSVSRDGTLYIQAAGLAIRWKDRSRDELEYHLERSADGAGWTRIATLPRNSRRHTDTDVSGGTRYCYRVRAANFGGTSEPSNQTCREP